jgi:glycosyltransferase involved in cell wall biosynthesis
MSEYVHFLEFTNHALINSFLGSGKLFIFPTRWEEPFGLVLVEAMACGTLVVTFACGSVPEVIKDGETGFIVNSSEEDKRGDWIVKKTGIEGLCEAVERIYSMPEEQYRQMRRACQAHVENNFTVEKMVDEYEKIHKQILEKRQS